MFGDLYNIADRIKSIDRNFRIIWDRRKCEYLIYHKNVLFMRCDKLTHETLKHIKKTVYININGNIEEEVEKNNNKIELQKQKELDDLAYNAAHDIAKPLRRALNY